MSQHPYKELSDNAFWRRSVSGVPSSEVDPVDAFSLRIDRETKVATAGSCFAQHIARHLRTAGFNYYVPEPGHPILPPGIREKHNYGLFSARYGNIYTARQLWQLFRRAYGEFTPLEDAWIEADGSVKDPFRPTTQPGGFVSVAEMHADRRQHLAAVREMFETLDVFVFTLGLTECWISHADGAVFPLCPGVEGGLFDTKKYGFYNQTVEDVVADMSAFLDRLSAINGAAKVILTVSPVPLMATAEPGAHVLAATTYSKAVLRVAAETLRKRYRHVYYFPSYEIITGSFNRGRYYSDDLRNVTDNGVAHVMRLFLQHATGAEPVSTILTEQEPASRVDDFVARAQAFVEVECDEVALDRTEESSLEAGQRTSSFGATKNVPPEGDLITAQKHVRMHNLWVPASDSKVLARYSESHGLLDLDISKVAKAVKLCTQRGRALDIGAHIGATSVFLSRHFVNVSAFEAIPRTFETLLMNVGDLENVQAFNLAISSDKSELFFSHFPTHGQLSHVETALDTREAERVGPIAGATIDSFAYDDVSFIKIDVAGYELPALVGAQATILRCRPVILLEQAGNDELYFGRKRNEASEFLESLGLGVHPKFPEKLQNDRCYKFLRS